MPEEEKTRDGALGSERRRPRWAEFRRSYPGILLTLAIALAALIAMDVWIIAKQRRYRNEIQRLRASMTRAERERADEIVAHEENKLRLAIELLRRQARLERALHLSVSTDSSSMYLEREGALLREMPVQVGPERRVGTPPDTVRLAPPRGVRTIERVLTDDDAWDVPLWVYTDRGLSPEAESSRRGALGPVAILLSGGALIYSMPRAGPLSDSTYVLPGAIRARAADLRAIQDNLTAGVRVYFY